MNFHIEIQELRAAADSMSSCVRSVASNKSSSVGDVATSLASSMSAASATALDTEWEQALADWGTSAQAFVDSLRNAADQFAALDQQSSDRMQMQ